MSDLKSNGRCEWRVGERHDGECWRDGVQVQVFKDGATVKNRMLCEPHHEELEVIQERRLKSSPPNPTPIRR